LPGSTDGPVLAMPSSGR